MIDIGLLKDIRAQVDLRWLASGFFCAGTLHVRLFLLRKLVAAKMFSGSVF